MTFSIVAAAYLADLMSTKWAFGLTRHAPFKMLDKVLRFLDHSIKEDEGFLDLQGSKIGYSTRVEKMIDPSSMPSKTLTAKTHQTKRNVRNKNQLTI